MIFVFLARRAKLQNHFAFLYANGFSQGPQSGKARKDRITSRKDKKKG